MADVSSFFTGEWGKPEEVRYNTRDLLLYAVRPFSLTSLPIFSALSIGLSCWGLEALLSGHFILSPLLVASRISLGRSTAEMTALWPLTVFFFLH